MFALFKSYISTMKIYLNNVQKTILAHMFEATSYYPYGLTMAGISSQAAGRPENRFKYNGKEMQHQEFSDGSGLEAYDFGARMQDPQLGVWHNLDPRADAARQWSPYAYALDNPIRFIDLDGMWAETAEGYTTTDPAEIQDFVTYLQSLSVNSNDVFDDNDAQQNTNSDTFDGSTMDDGGKRKKTTTRAINPTRKTKRRKKKGSPNNPIILRQRNCGLSPRPVTVNTVRKVVDKPGLKSNLMKIVFLLLAFWCMSCKTSKNTSNAQFGPALSSRSLLPKFKVTRLDSVDHVYLIYAEKNGQLYKILSKKDDGSDCKNIRVGGEYGFLIESLFPPMISKTGDTLWNRLDMVNAVKYNGTTIATEAGCVNNLFRADNVVGLGIKY